MKYRIVVIDDLRIPADGVEDIEVTLHTTPSDGLAALQALQANDESISELWLDHDMGFDDDDELTIWPVVEWLEERGRAGNPLKVTYIFVHTLNPIGADRMIAALSPHYKVGRAELPVKKS